MAAEDLKHLFAQGEKEESSESNDLELLDELSFATKDTTESMSFDNLPKNNIQQSFQQTEEKSNDALILKLITDRLDSIENKVNNSQVDYKVNTLVELKVTDHKITNLLQRILNKSAESKQEVMAIKKLLNDLLKKAS